MRAGAGKGEGKGDKGCAYDCRTAAGLGPCFAHPVCLQPRLHLTRCFVAWTLWLHAAAAAAWLLLLHPQEQQLIVKDVVVLIDREQGGAAHLAKNGLNLHAAFKLSAMLDILQVWGPDLRTH